MSYSWWSELHAITESDPMVDHMAPQIHAASFRVADQETNQQIQSLVSLGNVRRFRLASKLNRIEFTGLTNPRRCRYDFSGSVCRSGCCDSERATRTPYFEPG